MSYVIYSADESTRQAEPMFWSNDDGWVALYEATTYENMDATSVIISGQWMTLEHAYATRDVWARSQPSPVEDDETSLMRWAWDSLAPEVQAAIMKERERQRKEKREDA